MMKKRGLKIILAMALCLAPVVNKGIFSGAADAAEMPEWISNTKLKGDIRFRYQTEDYLIEEEVGEDTIEKEIDRERWRLRWRFGLETNPNDQWKVAFGMASGSSDPRSTNQTLENFFDTPDAMLDYAYTSYTPLENIELTLGKFSNPIWNPKDLLWDSDIMPEGLSAGFTFDAAEAVKLFITPSYLILDEEKTSEDDPTLMALQAGAGVDFTEDISTKLGLTYYKFNDYEDLEDDDSAWSVEAEAGFSGLPVYVGIFGQYVASEADDDNTGYLFGAKAGDKKVKELGDWELKYNYRKIEMYAWPSIFPDSDFMVQTSADSDDDLYTGVEGSEIEFTLGLHKNVNIALDYYMVEAIDSDHEKDTIQVDLNVKFP
jgi:hypothetical protein